MPYQGLESHALAFDSIGNGDPILFGHSYLMDTSMWMPQVDAFKDSYRCLMPELWGHGRVTELPDSVSTLTDLTAQYAKWFGTQSDTPAIVVGLSVGGMWATELALNHPELVKAVVLMGTSVAPEPEESLAKYLGMLRLVEQLETLPSGMIAQLVPLFFSPYTMAANPMLIRQFEARLATIGRDQIPAVVSLGRMIFQRASLMDRLGELEVPVLILVGADDRARPVRESEAMVERIPDARLAVIPQAGHLCNLEQPRHVNGVLEEFFQDLH